MNKFMNKDVMRRAMTRKNLLWGGGLLFLILLGFWWFRGGKPPKAGSMSVSPYEVTAGDIVKDLYLSGTIQPLYSGNVASPVNGKIKEVLVKEGDKISKGALVLRLNEDDLISKMETARAKYIKAQTKVTEIEHWESSYTYINAKANLTNYQADFEDREKEFLLNKELYQAKAISKKDLDRSELDLAKSAASLEGAKAQIKEALNKGSPESLREAQAELIAAKIAYLDAQKDLEYKEIFAPSSGYVSFPKGGSSKLTGGMEKALIENRPVTPGEVLMTVEDYENLTVDVYVDEFDLLQIQINQPCTIFIPAFPKDMFNGKVVATTSETADKATLFKSRCLIEKPDPKTKIGMTGQVNIPLEKKTGVLKIPISALVKKGGVSGVYLIEDKPERSYKFTPVKMGLVTMNEAEITEGLQEGQKILAQVPGELIEGSGKGR